MAPPEHYDSIILGSGQAGTPLASACARAGRKTALIEREHVGGCCVNEGCTPTKTMIANGRVAHLMRRAAEYGVSTGGDGQGKKEVVVDMEKVRQRKRDMVDSFRSGNESRLQAAGVEVIRDEASFRDVKTLIVKMDSGEEATVTGDSIFINTGERPARPHLDGLDSIEPSRVLDSTSIQELDHVPDHLVVLGGGYIGLEFGQLFRRLGAAVTIVQRGPQLLPREDADVAECMLQILREDGVTVHLSTSATKLAAQSSSSSAPIEVHVESSDTAVPATVTGSHLLFAAGRVPNTAALNLSAANITTHPGLQGSAYVTTNPRLETSVPGIYALGDVKGPPAFTHISYDDFRILRHNLLEHPAAPPETKLTTRDAARSRAAAPYVVYTDPQLGHVGFHAAAARAAFPTRHLQLATMPMAYVARALETGESRGMMKAVVDGASGEILEFTCLGLEGGEVMSVVQVAMLGGVGWKELRDSVFAHPTLAESLNNLWGFLEDM
ncbi:hypothetical protein LTR16_004114 [Cryomyces antarcticus]|uniref:Mercuric reductase n=1 Tax=Cryomyces antarcticus TaxID=329879 RepID=A0ABR0KTI2_9PEZI|nr:hypothetical protein LTR16_004114 [Cryomyces antarcticus]